MKLERKRELVSRALKIGKNRVAFNTQRLAELKEAITKQDIKDLKESGAIIVKEKKGRKKIQKRKTRRRAGSVKKKIKTRKQDYVTLTRKLRSYLAHLKKLKQISQEDFQEIRKEIRASSFRSLAHMKERISTLGQEKTKKGVKKHTKKTTKRKQKKKK
ncbi:MAG: 50S ribosomal protein L19e [Nanoarchaeota archaeon]